MNPERPLADTARLGGSASLCGGHLSTGEYCKVAEKTGRIGAKLLTTRAKPGEALLTARGNKRERGGLAKGRSRTPGGRQLPGRTTDFVTAEEEHLFKGDIENYILGQQIGQGAYATVRLCTQKSSNSPVALKIYEKSRISEPHRKRNLLREMEIMQQLDHPNCVKMLEAVNAGRKIYLVMEYVRGESLFAKLKQRPFKRMEEWEACGVFSQVVAGLQYCHSRNIAHRDIKLENVIMDDLHSVKIIDFGFSTHCPAGEKSKIFCGTPSYMSPEIVQRKDYLGQAADVWALGVLLFALLSGSFPFRGLSDKELYARISKGSYLTPHCISPAAKALIQSMLNVDLAKRPTCTEIMQHEWLTGAMPLAAKDANVAEQKPSPGPVDPPKPRRSMLSALFQKYQVFRKPEGGFTYTQLHPKAKGKENRE